MASQKCCRNSTDRIDLWPWFAFVLRYDQYTVIGRQRGRCQFCQRGSKEHVCGRNHPLGPYRQPGCLRGGGVSGPEGEGQRGLCGAGGTGNFHVPVVGPAGLADQKQRLGELWLMAEWQDAGNKMYWLHNSSRCATRPMCPVNICPRASPSAFQLNVFFVLFPGRICWVLSSSRPRVHGEEHTHGRCWSCWPRGNTGPVDQVNLLDTQRLICSHPFDFTQRTLKA